MKSILFCVHFLWAACAQSQPCTYKLTGTVVTDLSEFLGGATVELLPGFSTTTTDLGIFQFENVCTGAYRLRVRFVGFEPYEISVQIPVRTPLTVVLTAQKTLLDVVEVHDHFEHVSKTNNFQTLSGKELDETRGLSIGEALKRISGVSSIQTGPSIFKPVIHGLHSQRILILNNGIRQEGQQWGAEHAPEIDPFIASNIIIIKDASAIKYGTDALGGVVVVNPADLPEQKGVGGELNVITQTNGRAGTLSGTLEGGSEKFKGFGWRVQGTGRKSGDAHTPDYMLSNTGFTEFNFSLAAGMHKKSKGVDLFFSRFQTELGILKGSSISSTEDLRNAMDRKPPQYTQPFTYAVENPRQEVSHNLLKVNGHLHTNYGDFKVQYGFQYNTRKEFDIRRDSLNFIPAIDLELITNTFDAEWQQHTSKRFLSSAGINTMIQINNNQPGTQRIPFIPDFSNYTGGLFYTGKLNLTTWAVDFGARYDYRYYQVVGYDFANRLYSSTYSLGNASFSLGATRSFHAHSVFVTNLASSWRPPHVSELYSFGVHQSVAAIEYGLLLDEATSKVLDFNAVDFKNEKALKWVNTWHFHKNRFTTEITGYANYIFNYIYLKPYGVTQTVRGAYPFFRYTQTNASFVGADLLGKADATENFSLTGKISLLRAYDQTNTDYLIYIPSNRYELGMEWRIAVGENRQVLTCEANALYVDEQRRAPRVVTVDEILDAYTLNEDPFENNNSNFDFMPAPPPYFLLNLQAGTSLWIGNAKLDVRLRAANLLNTTYREYTNRIRYYADETGRNIALSLKLSF
ncbi:TonB-dependent receptor plug domain-containing protein [Oscillatoria amoena NRMC-F 0135]|nr:TonB-dependent receptor plug domain-containing protein [Oscillatoria amoena NRMC-F 0135]